MTLWVVPQDIAIDTAPKRIYCNKLMPAALTNAFANLIYRHLEDQLKTWDGCFNIRTKRGGRTTSLHAWGVAIDVNASENPFGKKPKMSAEFVKAFEDAGFDWGGYWAKPDGMHFQLKSLDQVAANPRAVSRPAEWLDLPVVSPPYADRASRSVAYHLFGKPMDLGDAIRVFQASKGLYPDGVIGPKTWAILLDRK